MLAAAGCGKSQLYHYFDGKSDLLGAVIDQQLESVLAAQPALARIESWETFDTWMADIIAMHAQPGGPFACPLGTLAVELNNDDAFRKRLDEAFGRWIALLADGLQTMQDHGHLVTTADPQRLAANVIAALQGGMLLGRLRGDITPMGDAADAARAQLRRWAPPAVDHVTDSHTASAKEHRHGRSENPR